MRKLAAITVAALAVILTACSAPETATRATVTTTAPAQTVTTTATAPPATVTQTVTETAPIVSTEPAEITDLALYCATINAAYDYIDAVEENYWLKDGSAPFSFVLQVAQEASDTIDTVGRIYTSIASSDTGRDISIADRFGVAALKSGSVEDNAVKDYRSYRTVVRNDCRTALG